MSTVSLTRSLHVAALERSESEWPGDGLQRLVTLENVRLRVAGASYTITQRRVAAAGVVLATRTLQNCSKRSMTRTWHQLGGRVPESFRWTLDSTLSGATPPPAKVPLPAGVTLGDSTEVEIPTDVAGGALSASRLVADTLVAEAAACSKVRVRLVARSSREQGLLDLHVHATADAEVTVTSRESPRPLEIQRFRISLVVTLSGSYDAETWVDVEHENAQLSCSCPSDSPCGQARDDEPFIGPDIVDEPTATSIPPSLPPLSFRAAPRPLTPIDEPPPGMVETTAVRIEPPPEFRDDPDTEEYPRSMEAVQGIGASTAEKLRGAGIDDLPALAGVDPEAVRIPGISARRLDKWKQEARRLLGDGQQ